VTPERVLSEYNEDLIFFDETPFSFSYNFTFQRFRRVGAFVTSCETVLLQWVADKQHEKFKAVQNLIKVLPPDTGLSVKSSM